MGPLSITCGTKKSCSNMTTEVCTCDVSEVLFGNRSRIVNKLYIYTRTDKFSICEYRDWTLIAWVVVTLSQKREVPRSKPGCDTRHNACIILIKNDSFWKFIQLSKRTWNACNDSFTISPCRGMVRTRDYIVSRSTKCSLSNQCDIPF